MRCALVLLVTLCCQLQLAYAQGRNNLFLIGYTYNYRCDINFLNGFPAIQIDTIRTINFNRTNANITDSNGNLLFYTNGVVIANANQDTMLNGSGLNPCAYTTSWSYEGLRITQANLILPDPGDSNNYYLFHESAELYPNLSWRPLNLYYTTVNMTLDSGLGAVVQKNISVLQDTLGAGQITACKHANGRDWWIVVPEYGTNGYYILMLTPAGVSFASKQFIGQKFYESQAAFSPNGEHYGSYAADVDIEMFDFDRCTGTFSNARHVAINDNNFGFGFSFSPNSKLAYASSAHFLYQVNLDSVNLAASLDTVAVWDSTYSPFPPIETGFDLQQLAPDGKIYIATTGSTEYMHYINFPDSAGSACNVVQHGLYLDSALNWNTVPNHPNYFLGPVVGSICDSLSLGITDNVYDKNMLLTVNPNPAKNNFYLNYNLPTGKNATLYVYNTLGNLIHKQWLYGVNNNLLIHCNTWPQGMYYLKVVMDNKERCGYAKVIIAN
jgi:uncharacterized protein (DUF427 family)